MTGRTVIGRTTDKLCPAVSDRDAKCQCKPGDPNTSSRSRHAGQGRVVTNTYADAISDQEAVEAVFANPALWELAAMVPRQRTGAPRKLPTIYYLSMLGLASVWSSFRDAEAQLKRRQGRPGLMWRHVCEVAAHYQRIHCPTERPFDLDALVNKAPLTAQNFFDARSSWLADCLDGLEEIFESSAALIAREVGYGDSDGEGSINNLVRENTVEVDGKVVTEVGSHYTVLDKLTIRALNEGKPKGERVSSYTHVVDKHTGEVIPATDMVGEERYVTGGGLKIGHKYIAASVRDDQPNSTVVLSLRKQVTTSEAQELTDAVLSAKQKLPGLHGMTGDTAFHGEHLRQLMRSGMVPVVPIAARSHDIEGHRIEKEGLYTVLDHDHPGGYKCVHEIHYYVGGLCEWRPDDRGELRMVDFGDPRALPRHDKKAVRMYAEFTITCREGLAPDEPAFEVQRLLANLTQQPSRAKGALNVAENIRLVPPGGDTSKRVYGWRGNAENGNRQRDHRKHLGRARSRGAARQHQNEIGAAIMGNGVALLRARDRARDEMADAALPFAV